MTTSNVIPIAGSKSKIFTTANPNAGNSRNWHTIPKTMARMLVICRRRHRISTVALIPNTSANNNTLPIISNTDITVGDAFMVLDSVFAFYFVVVVCRLGRNVIIFSLGSGEISSRLVSSRRVASQKNGSSGNFDCTNICKSDNQHSTFSNVH